MRLIGQEVDALAEHQLNEFAGERLLTGLALKCRSRPTAACQSESLCDWFLLRPCQTSSTRSIGTAGQLLFSDSFCNMALRVSDTLPIIRSFRDLVR